MRNVHDMGYWSRSETELLINLEGRDPALAYIQTNWQSYIKKLQECQGYEQTGSWTAPDGRQEINGQVTLNPFRFLHLRSKLAGSLVEEFEQAKAELPEFSQAKSPFRLGPGERETVISATQDEPFWMWICTDMMWWMKTLQEHDWAILTREVEYAGADDGGSAVQQTFAVPRALFQVRKARPQISDEQKAKLIERLQG